MRKGTKHSKESKKKMSNALMGKPAWNKGLEGYLKGRVTWNKGLTKENNLILMKMALKKTGVKQSSETIAKRAAGMLGRVVSLETRRKISESEKGKFVSKESIRKSLTRRPMSSLEIKVNEIIKNNNLPYKFVGNGEFFIENKNPDFININGEKKAVEVYYRKHKERFKNKSIKQWQIERSNIFKQYGWSIIFIDEIHSDELSVISLLREGKND